MLNRRSLWLLPLSFFLAFAAECGEDDLRAKVELLMKEVDALKKERADHAAVKEELSAIRKEQSTSNTKVTPATVDKALDSKYGPSASAVTKTGKLTLSGLLQCWYYHIQDDSFGLFGDLTPGVTGGGDTNQTRDNDSFRIRRAEFKFSFDLDAHLTGVIMVDPAREAQSYPILTSNLGLALRGRTNETSAAVTNVQSGAGGAARMLKDAYINYHGYVPHHDFQIGQYKAPVGEEGIRNAGELDFAERALLTQLVDVRDIGAHVHGTWVNDRVQYWIGAYSSAGNLHNSDGNSNDRSDTNDNKDLLLRGLFRPVWKDCLWGSLEFTWTSQFGTHGEGTPPLDANGDGDFADAGDNVGEGLARSRSWASRHYASIYYAPGGCMSGAWLRGEWGRIQDTNAPLAVRGFPQNTAASIQTAPGPLTIMGWYASAGYKIADTPWAECAPKQLLPFEFAMRYEWFQNVTVGDLVNPARRTDVFASKISTLGVNYYLKGSNAKIQLMYNWVNDPSSSPRGFREVHNDNLIAHFQLMF